MTDKILTTEEALLAAIRETPGDDTPRLAYADWLDENAGVVPCRYPNCKGGQVYEMRECRDGILRNAWGPCPQCKETGTIPDDRAARAEFIRVQCELAAWDRDSVGGVLHSTHINTLRDREREIAESGVLEGVFGPTLPDGFYWTTADFPIKAEIAHAVVSRGFVGAITCTAAAFLGGECGQCGGHGRLIDYPEDEQPTCPHCHGKKRTKGIAAAVFAAHPVQSLTLSDREPGRHAGGVGDRAGYWWEPGIRYDVPRQIPFELGEAGIAAGVWRVGFHGGLMVYTPPTGKLRDRGWDTPELALSALSAACVRYGRALAATKESA